MLHSSIDKLAKLSSYYCRIIQKKDFLNSFIFSSFVSITPILLSTSKMATSTRSKKAKLDTGVDRPNLELANMLTELAEFEKNVNRQIYKFNAYRKVAQELLNNPIKITTIEEAKKIKGVGTSIAEKIEEYLNTGRIAKLDLERKSDDAHAIQELTRVTGIGPAAAQLFLRQGIRTIEDLKANVDKLNHHQRIGLNHLEDFEKRIPREEMLKLEDVLIINVKSVDDKYEVTICGSFRRGAETSGDLDVLITHPKFTSTSIVEKSKKRKSKKELEPGNIPHELLKPIVERLESIKFITDSIAFGDTKFMGVCRLDDSSVYRRIDIRLIPVDQYYLGVLYFTGSNVFNQNMRKIALEKGYTLNEYSLRRLRPNGTPGKPLHIESEEDIFKYLDMEYKRPEERNS